MCCSRRWCSQKPLCGSKCVSMKSRFLTSKIQRYVWLKTWRAVFRSGTFAIMNTPNCKNGGTMNLPSPDLMPRSPLRSKPVRRRSHFWSLCKPLHQAWWGSAVDQFLQLVFAQTFLAAKLMWDQRVLSHISTCSSECSGDYFFSSHMDQTLSASGASQSPQGIISHASYKL